MGKAADISTMDLSKGYQVPLRPEDRPKTAFASQAGKYQFTKMPFGLKGAPSTFQRLMDVVLAPCAQFASAYIDDITIFSDSWEDHLQHLDQVLQCLQKAGLTAKPPKCFLATTSCSFLGHRVGGGRVALEEAKVAAIADRAPNGKSLGLAGYYRRFVQSFAEKAALLTDCTKKEYPDKIKWTQDPNAEGSFWTKHLTRWAMALQQYSFTVRYRPGKENGNADGLS